mmetsp:Transcript_32581/g.103184  ORF Transcript_32581/g.103184 Transcript_32581/m.103184 type:complete len:113 (-) Transcript_32581:758-1096(-)
MTLCLTIMLVWESLKEEGISSISSVIFFSSSNRSGLSLISSQIEWRSFLAWLGRLSKEEDEEPLTNLERNYNSCRTVRLSWEEVQPGKSPTGHARWILGRFDRPQAPARLLL